ncbi:Uncharacterised protein [Streptococcus pneumoniae]|nr:Uncharacterised protein [Streptococcus pneumoniae]CVR49258.1 Uncharacterised protein [Streptococcus pneumoniae]
MSEYWFSTNVDQIDEVDGKQCLIYSYYNVKASRNVEVLKGRSGTKKGLDYWEPYAPQKQYEMERSKINILEVLRQTDGMALKKMLSFVIVKNMFLLLIYFSITIILKKFLLNVVNKIL